MAEIRYPRITGHEVAGIVHELGANVSAFKVGQRAGVGWHGGQDGTCPSCRRGDFRKCRNLKIPGAVGPLSLPTDTRQLCLREHV